MNISELLSLIYIYNQELSHVLNRRKPKFSNLQKLENNYFINQLEDFIRTHNIETRVEQDPNEVLTDEEKQWFAKLLNDRWNGIQDTESSYTLDLEHPSNVICIAIAKSLAKSLNKKWIELLMPTVHGIANPYKVLTYEDKTDLMFFVMNDDNTQLIHRDGALKEYHKTRQTTKVINGQTIPLSENERDRVFFRPVHINSDRKFLALILSSEIGIKLFCKSQLNVDYILKLEFNDQLKFIRILWESDIGKVYLEKVIASSKQRSDLIKKIIDQIIQENNEDHKAPQENSPEQDWELDGEFTYEQIIEYMNSKSINIDISSDSISSTDEMVIENVSPVDEFDEKNSTEKSIEEKLEQVESSPVVEVDAMDIEIKQASSSASLPKKHSKVPHFNVTPFVEALSRLDDAYTVRKFADAMESYNQAYQFLNKNKTGLNPDWYLTQERFLKSKLTILIEAQKYFESNAVLINQIKLLVEHNNVFEACSHLTIERKVLSVNKNQFSYEWYELRKSEMKSQLIQCMNYIIKADLGSLKDTYKKITMTPNNGWLNGLKLLAHSFTLDNSDQRLLQSTLDKVSQLLSGIASTRLIEDSDEKNSDEINVERQSFAQNPVNEKPDYSFDSDDVMDIDIEVKKIGNPLAVTSVIENKLHLAAQDSAKRKRNEESQLDPRLKKRARLSDSSFFKPAPVSSTMASSSTVPIKKTLSSKSPDHVTEYENVLNDLDEAIKVRKFNEASSFYDKACDFLDKNKTNLNPEWHANQKQILMGTKRPLLTKAFKYHEEKEQEFLKLNDNLINQIKRAIKHNDVFEASHYLHKEFKNLSDNKKQYRYDWYEERKLEIKSQIIQCMTYIIGTDLDIIQARYPGEDLKNLKEWSNCLKSLLKHFSSELFDQNMAQTTLNRVDHLLSEIEDQQNNHLDKMDAL